jgi:hypothetical protein
MHHQVVNVYMTNWHSSLSQKRTGIRAWEPRSLTTVSQKSRGRAVKNVAGWTRETTEARGALPAKSPWSQSWCLQRRPGARSVQGEQERPSIPACLASSSLEKKHVAKSNGGLLFWVVSSESDPQAADDTCSAGGRPSPGSDGPGRSTSVMCWRQG